MIAAIPFPDISPEIFSTDLFGIHLAVRWYALGYIVGILIGWRIIAAALARPQLWAGPVPMTRDQLESLVTWMILAIVIGGRLGFVLFYQPGWYLAHPLDILKVWTGGMSFHGGFLGVVLAAWVFARRHGLPVLSLADLLAIATPPALGLVRVANFINAELWGRPTTMPWGVIFPGELAQSCATATAPCARHPSQLYEAALEGLVLAVVLLTLAFRKGWLKVPGRLAGTFFLGYGLARFFVEFYRLADPQYITPDNPWGHVLLGMTMGQLLSLPMILAGIGTLVWANRRARP
ncbi:MAG: prolipoprotein diacylglyceryl transferase [Alphaproteobacteria bacterium]|nr:MAG: prolipoprotein diacylglyceryl transferase [Alphaproteobacteria bacterium]